MILPAAAAALALGMLVPHLATIGLCLKRWRRAPVLADIADMPPITLLRPVRGLEHDLEATLRTSFRLEALACEVLFCVAQADDPAIPLIHRLIAEHPEVPARLLIGDDRVSGNPKLNNLVKGWAMARHDWIAMADSNLSLPPDYLRQLVGCWTPGTGLVSSPGAGVAPGSFWAQLECAFLDSHQARWQLAADSVGLGFAQGKTLFWRRDILDAAGGLRALGGDMAEDVAATKLIRRRGLRVRVVRQAFQQPLGPRSFAEVWGRQVRWARIRRMGFPGLYLAEFLSGGLIPALLVTALAATGLLSPVAPLIWIALWYGAEAWLCRAAGWPLSLPALPLRDALLPVIWVAGWVGSGFAWRGTDMAAAHFRPGEPEGGQG